MLRCCWSSPPTSNPVSGPAGWFLVPRAAHRNVRHRPGILGPPVRSKPDHSRRFAAQDVAGPRAGRADDRRRRGWALATWLTPLADWPRASVAASLPRVPFLPAAVARIVAYRSRGSSGTSPCRPSSGTRGSRTAAIYYRRSVLLDPGTDDVVHSPFSSILFTECTLERDGTKRTTVPRGLGGRRGRGAAPPCSRFPICCPGCD